MNTPPGELDFLNILFRVNVDMSMVQNIDILVAYFDGAQKTLKEELCLGTPIKVAGVRYIRDKLETLDPMQ